MKRVTKVKQVEMTSGLIYGEVTLIPVCGICGCERLYVQMPGIMFRRSKCPDCGHKLNWHI